MASILTITLLHSRRYFKAITNTIWSNSSFNKRTKETKENKETKEDTEEEDLTEDLTEDIECLFELLINKLVKYLLEKNEFDLEGLQYYLRFIKISLGERGEFDLSNNRNSLKLLSVISKYQFKDCIDLVSCVHQFKTESYKTDLKKYYDILMKLSSFANPKC